MNEIQKLIELWNARPARVEPDDDDHLLYIFTGLLPALRDAMPKVAELVQQSALATAGPNTDLPPAPKPAPSSHNPIQIPSRDGTDEVSGPAADTDGRPAVSSANAAGIADGPAIKRTAGARRARQAKARKPAAAPPEQPPQIGESVTA